MELKTKAKVIKPSDAEKNLLILAGDVSYFVNAYIRKRVLTPDKPQQIEATRSQAIKQAKALIAAIQKLERT